VKIGDSKVMPELKKIKLRSFEDLVNIVIATQIPLVHHIALNEKHVYFLPFVGLGDFGIIYYFETNEPLKGKYIVYNKLDGKITLSSKINSDARLTFVPIIEVAEQNAFSLKIFESKKKKEKKKKK